MNKQKILIAIILGATLVAGLVIVAIISGIVQTNVPPVVTVIIMGAAWMATLFMVFLAWAKTN